MQLQTLSYNAYIKHEFYIFPFRDNPFVYHIQVTHQNFILIITIILSLEIARNSQKRGHIRFNERFLERIRDNFTTPEVYKLVHEQGVISSLILGRELRGPKVPTKVCCRLGILERSADDVGVLGSYSVLWRGI